MALVKALYNYITKQNGDITNPQEIIDASEVLGLRNQLDTDRIQDIINPLQAYAKTADYNKKDGDLTTPLDTTGETPPVPRERPATLVPTPKPRPAAPATSSGRGDGASPRNVRNNNPGNIRKSKDAWQGKTGNDGAFVTFDTPQNGVRALTKLLYNYQKKYNLNTITGIITRWAPPSENDTASYIALVASKTGIGADEEINLKANATLTKKFVKAIIQKEGSQAAVDYFDPYIDDGIAAVD